MTLTTQAVREMAEGLRSHVNARGGSSLGNGFWQRAINASDMLLALVEERDRLAEANAKKADDIVTLGQLVGKAEARAALASVKERGEMAPEKETITGVAILDEQGRLWSLPAPHRHSHIYALAALLGTSAETGEGGSCGFSTNYGRFLDRSKALQLVRRNKQELRRPWTSGSTNELYSEDLW